MTKLARWACVWLSSLVICLSTGSYVAADPNKLVVVDGTADKCVVNRTPFQNRPPNPEGNAIAFTSPRHGYCDGIIEHGCASNTQNHSPEYIDAKNLGFYTVTRTCVGNFVAFDERQSKILADLQSRFDQEISILRSNVKFLSNAVDMLNDKIDKMEKKPH